MGMNFTPEQQKVIELHNSNILVSAAAGSGKTAVLVERIIRMICEGEHPADIDRLLIVTFTNAAAAEMRERIAAGIAARLEADPGNDHIQKQSALLHNLLAELQHCILAHHGKLEYGSPKVPALIEAVALNYADDTDAKMETFKEILENNSENSGWLGYNRLFESNLRATKME